MKRDVRVVSDSGYRTNLDFQKSQENDNFFVVFSSIYDQYDEYMKDVEDG